MLPEEFKWPITQILQKRLKTFSDQILNDFSKIFKMSVAEFNLVRLLQRYRHLKRVFFCKIAFSRIFNTTSRLPDSPKLPKNSARESFFHVQHLSIERPLVIWVYLAHLNCGKSMILSYKSAKPIRRLIFAVLFWEHEGTNLIINWNVDFRNLNLITE